MPSESMSYCSKTYSVLHDIAICPVRGWSIRAECSYDGVSDVPAASPMARKPRSPKVPSKKAIIRAVASSTAIETGKSTPALERQMLDKKRKFRSLKLAE